MNQINLNKVLIFVILAIGSELQTKPTEKSPLTNPQNINAQVPCCQSVQKMARDLQKSISKIQTIKELQSDQLDKAYEKKFNIKNEMDKLYRELSSLQQKINTKHEELASAKNEIHSIKIKIIGLNKDLITSLEQLQTSTQSVA